MAAKSWETDFRYAAIRASLAALNNEHDDDLFNFPGSFCVPVAKKPVVGWTPGRIMLVCLVLGFVGLFGAAAVTRGNGNDAARVALGAALGVAGMSLFFLPLVFDRFIMRLLIGARGAELTHRPGDVLCAEISNADRTKIKISIDGDDYVLLLADHTDRRLLIEGIAARYQIRAADVTSLQSFMFMNYLGAQITFHVNNETSLTLAIARVSMLLELTRQLPFLFFLRARINNRILSVCQKTLTAPEHSP